MNKIVSFTINGEPATAGSKTGFYNKKTGRVIMAPANKRQKPWMNSIRAEAMLAYRESPKECPILLSLCFKLVRPKSHYGSGKKSRSVKESKSFAPIVKPDLTKLVRAAEDALKNVIWRDDSQVCQISASKIYIDRFTNEQPGVEITIYKIEKGNPYDASPTLIRH